MLSDYLRRQDGVITSEQARAAGLSRRSVQRRVQSGQWRRCGRGVYFVDDRPFSDAARIRAAVWGHGSQAAASGLTAASWHGLTRFAPDIVEVTVPRDSHGRRHEDTRVRRRDLQRCDVIELKGMRVTSLSLTVVEAAAQRGGGAKLLDTALQQRHVDLPGLWRTHLRNKGRTGAPRSRLLLQAAAGGAHSVAERILHQLLREAGIGGWKANYRVGGYRVDVGFAAQKVAIEVDGFAFHSHPDAFQIDRQRQNDLVLLGWQVLRFTWLDLTAYPDRVIALIRSAISAR
ncbi:type IV toxin-antitoxin system AbiEi family antitoxin domain-containing protein [Mycolicibacterium sp. S3B2]|uniref:type IV toxin-antitoxin system AbiEi family antitoxin domain-containing protein n=1 Tax=Mycolicibacterium sp. S3B2 TaxID=3415120 RepID=UPI003C7B74DF